MNAQRLRGPLTVMVAALLGGCTVAESPFSPTRSPAHPVVQVAVSNHNWMDMNVYVVRDGARVRLGTVGSMSSRRFTIPRSLDVWTGSVQLLADPIGSQQTYTSGSIMVSPGERIVWYIENQITLSNYRIEDAR